MCIFSGPVNSVSKTNIFARKPSPDKQILVYSMDVSTPTELAMILPIPTPANSAEDAVRFIDLSGYQDFFKDIEKGFPEPALRMKLAANFSLDRSMVDTLEVHQVGDFEASFVPSLDDMDRLDERFKLPRNIWNQIPEYDDWGFAVFKLKNPNKVPEHTDFYGRPRYSRSFNEVDSERTIHPMAFEFPTRFEDKIFFPTVHIHDEKVHDEEHFDHALFYQGGEPKVEKQMRNEFANTFNSQRGKAWRKSTGIMASFMDLTKDQGVLDARAYCNKCELRGNLPNEDTLVEIMEKAAV